MKCRRPNRTRSNRSMRRAVLGDGESVRFSFVLRAKGVIRSDSYRLIANRFDRLRDRMFDFQGRRGGMADAEDLKSSEG